MTIIGTGRSAEVVLDSDRSGINGAQIRLLDSAGSALEGQEVTFIAANPLAGVEPIRRSAEAIGPGIWHVEHLLLVPSGSWTIRIDVLISDFERVPFDAVVTLR